MGALEPVPNNSSSVAAEAESHVFEENEDDGSNNEKPQAVPERVESSDAMTVAEKLYITEVEKADRGKYLFEERFLKYLNNLVKKHAKANKLFPGG